MDSRFRLIACALLFFLSLSASSLRADSKNAGFKCEFGNKQTPVTLQGTKDSFTLLLRSTAPFSAEVFPLEKPPRIVMDFKGLKLKSHKSPPLPYNKILKGVRIAVSPAKVRIVLDLKIGSIPEYSTSQEGNSFSFSAGLKSDVLALMPKETPTQTPVPEASSSVPETPAPPAVEPEMTTLTPAATPAETPASPPAPEPSGTLSPVPSDVRALTSIDFQPAPEPMLRLSLTKESSFRLSKEKESYLLTVPECTVAGNHLLLPNYPPEGFPGINVVKGASEKGDLLLWIYVSRTERLSAFRNGTEIRVKVTENK